MQQSICAKNGSVPILASPFVQKTFLTSICTFFTIVVVQIQFNINNTTRHYNTKPVQSAIARHQVQTNECTSTSACTSRRFLYMCMCVERTLIQRINPLDTVFRSMLAQSHQCTTSITLRGILWDSQCMCVWIPTKNLPSVQCMYVTQVKENDLIRITANGHHNINMFLPNNRYHTF